MDEGEFVGEVGVFVGFELGELFVQEDFRPFDHAPDALDDIGEVIQAALVFGDGLFPVPLVHVGAVVVVQEIIFAHGAHVGAEAFAGLHVELAQGHALPFGGGLDDFGVNGVLVVIVGDVELHGGAGAVAVEVVVDAAFGINDEGDRDHYEVKLPA